MAVHINIGVSRQNGSDLTQQQTTITIADESNSERVAAAFAEAKLFVDEHHKRIERELDAERKKTAKG